MGSKNKQYVVKAGDSYERIAQRFKGDQRAFGDFMRANNYKDLKPGDVINVPQENRKSYFVSNKDVQAANGNAVGSALPKMQSYGEYQANYQAKNGGPASVGKTQLPTGGTGTAGAGSDLVTKANWKVTPSGQAAASAWQADNPNSTPGVTAEQALAIKQKTTVPISPALSTIGPAPAKMAGVPDPMNQMPKTLPTSGYTYGPNQPWSPTGFMKTNQFDATITPTTPTAQTPLPATTQTTQPTSGPGAKLEAYINAQSPSANRATTQRSPAYYAATAQEAVNAINTNAAVPQYINKNAMPFIKDAIATSKNPAGTAYAFSQIYDTDAGGNLVPKGSLLMPGAAQGLDTQSPYSSFTPASYEYDYSNIPPYGYNDSGNSRSGSGRSVGGGSGGGNQNGSGSSYQGYNTQNFTIRIGQ